MQSLTSRNPLIWGATTMAILTAICLVSAALYINPPAQKTVIFYTDDAASVQQGDEVRIAGIPVGKVNDVILEADRVRVQARVDRNTFIGNQSAIEVRMLTVVGGYYVDLVSLGDVPLGNDAIPLERVTMPYSLVRALNDATRITDSLATRPINEALNEIESGLRGNETMLRSVIDAGNSVMSTVDKQRGQISAILHLSEEYITHLSDFSGELRRMVEKVAIIQATLELYSKGLGAALAGLGHVVATLKTVGNFYENHRAEFLEKVDNFLVKGRMWIDRNGATVRGLRDIQRHIERILDTQQAPPELLATDLCIPMLGSPCQ